MRRPAPDTTAARRRAGDRVHPAVAAWRSLHGRARGTARIEPLVERENLPRVYRIRGLTVGPVVAKHAAMHLVEFEAERYAWLAASGVPSLRCLGVVPDELVPEAGWLFLEDAGEEAYSPCDPDHLEASARWLALLHSTALVTAPGHLDARDTAWSREHLTATRTALRAELSESAPSERRVLAGMLDMLDELESGWDGLEAICNRFAATLVHGDIQRKNMRIRRGREGPELVVFDWEMSGLGCPAIDLGFLMDETIDALAVRYASHARPRIEPTEARRLARAGRALRLVSAVHWATFGLRHDAMRAEALAELRWYLSVPEGIASWDASPGP